MKVHIPASIEEAIKTLNGIGALLTAKGWERAAIVYAFTQPQQGRRSDFGEKSPKLTIEAFAALGISGLTTRNTVREYRETWQKYGSPVQPGDTVTLPTIDWPPLDHGRGSHATSSEVREALVKNPQIVVEAIKAVPAVKDAVADHVAGDTDLHHEVEHRVFEKKMGRKYTGPSTPLMSPPPLNHNYKTRDLVFALAEELRLEREGEWEADGLTETLLRLLNISLNDRHKKEQPDIFDEIRSHLSTTAQEGAA